jgi:LuxR family maltose regulon positive regulatory protein
VTPGFNGRAMAGRVLSELAGQRGRLILVTGDRHEPTSHELTSPDALAQLTRLLTNLPGDAHAVPATVAISRCACISCAWPAS